MESVKKMKTAIIGCGVISDVYIRNLNNLFSIIDLTALCDLNQAAAKEKAEKYGIKQTMTLEELEEAEEIELVVNLTNPAAHYDVIKRMLNAGKHVYTEKVLTPELEKGRELIKLADEKGLYLGVSPDTILGAGIQTAKKILDAGLIGQVTSCMVSVNRNQVLNSEVFRFLRGDGGALPKDVGIYYVAALLVLLGPVKSIRGFGANSLLHQAEFLYQEDVLNEWEIPGNNLVTGALEFENGVLGSLHFNGNTVNVERSMFMIYGTEGILELGDPNSFNGYVKLSRPESETCDIPFTHGYNGQPTLPQATNAEYTYGHRGVGAAEMAWAVRMNRPNRCNKELGLHTMEVLCGLDEAIASGTEYKMQSSFECRPLKSGYLSAALGGQIRADAERSLIE